MGDTELEYRPPSSLIRHSSSSSTGPQIYTSQIPCTPLETCGGHDREQRENDAVTQRRAAICSWGLGWGRHWSSREAWAFSRWFGWGGMNVQRVDVVEDGQLDTRLLLPPCVIADPHTFGIRTLRRSVPAYMLMTRSGRPVLLLSHPQVLAGGTPSTPETFASSRVLDR